MTSHSHNRDDDHEHAHGEVTPVTDRTHDNSWSVNLEKPQYEDDLSLIKRHGIGAVEQTTSGHHVNLVTHKAHGHPEESLYDALNERIGDGEIDTISKLARAVHSVTRFHWHRRVHGAFLRAHSPRGVSHRRSKALIIRSVQPNVYEHLPRFTRATLEYRLRLLGQGWIPARAWAVSGWRWWRNHRA